MMKDDKPSWTQYFQQLGLILEQIDLAGKKTNIYHMLFCFMIFQIMSHHVHVTDVNGLRQGLTAGLENKQNNK